ncbi:MAG: ATP-binding protein [Burkholderiaceae bacterium]|nr:ATP-binding protein [Burkholderiaceae bacterium]
MPGGAAAQPAIGGGPDLLPRQPKSVEDTGLERSLIVELIAKDMSIAGKTHLSGLTGALRLPINVLREALDFMVKEQLAEVAWRGASDVDVQYRLTAAGKQRAAVCLERCAYVGPAPVTLEAYRAMAERQRQRQRVGAADVAAVFDDDDFDPGVLEQIGAAMHSGRSLFLYGPPGGGKSTLAGKLGALLPGMVALPHAVLVGQEIIALYDPALHLPPAPPYALQARQAQERRSGDARWTLCQRPVLRVGAELCPEMLALRHDGYSGSYQAPLHLKANHGMLVIDDLGRQRIAANELLQRYMQPLDAGLDQLTLRGGHKFSVPFDVLLVFATNLAPQSLLDASFLRRLGYKIHVGPLGARGYAALFRRQCRAASLACDDAVVRHLLERLHGASGRPLLASYPHELLGRVADFAGCAGLAPSLTVAALEQAWNSMFAACDMPAPGLAGDLCETIQ